MPFIHRSRTALIASDHSGGQNYDLGDFDFNFGAADSAGGGIFDELFNRAGRGQTRRNALARGRNIEATLELSLEDGHRGGRHSLQLQTANICPTCNGSGVVDGETCLTCKGSRRVVQPKMIELNIPAGARDGATLSLARQVGAGATTNTYG